MISLNEIVPGVLDTILSFQSAKDLAAVSETSKEMRSFVIDNDKLWQSFLPTFPCHSASADPRIHIPEEWVDPRHINGFENLPYFYQAKQLQEYKHKAVAAFHTRRMELLEDNTEKTTAYYLDDCRRCNDSNTFGLSATQRQKLLTRLTKDNLASCIVEVSIQTFENEGMSWDCLLGTAFEWEPTSVDFDWAVHRAVTGLPSL